MKILPDEIPDETHPLSDGESVPAPLCRGDNLRQLDGKNVFVSFNNKKNVVGGLNCSAKFFEVGSSESIFLYGDVESFREV